MMATLRKRWFGLAAAFAVAGLAVIFPTERTWLVGLAAFGAFVGMVDWLFGREEDDGR